MTLTTVVRRLLSLPTFTARWQTIIVIIQRYAPTTVSAAITPFSGLFANVVHTGSFLAVYGLWKSLQNITVQMKG
jgi:hypothetical protein